MAKIILVDDHKDIVDTLKMIVQKEGHTTAEAYNGQDFINKIEKEKPDLAILDVMMPGLTTREILTEIKKLGLQNTKIILVTVVRFSEREIKSMMADFNIVDYIQKPFDLTDLIARLRKALA